jgi:ATP-dependent protease HslVU (ClpYQ) peptidase subunit
LWNSYPQGAGHPQVIHNLYESLKKFAEIRFFINIKKHYDSSKKFAEIVRGRGYNTHMTCVVGVAHEGIVYIGGERAASDGGSIVSMCRPKVIHRGEWLIGYSNSVGVGQLMEFIKLPTITKDPYIHIRMDMVEALKKSHDIYGKEHDENYSDFLIGAQGRLFEFSTQDWSVIEIQESAVGSGSDFALGSLHTSKHYKDQHKRLRMALEAAIEYSTGCKGPIDILSL